MSETSLQTVTAGSLTPAPGTAAGELVEAFLSGRNERTLRAYNRDLRDFASFLNLEDLDQAAAFLLGGGHGPANALALRYRANLMERGLAAATVNRRLAALRSLVKLARTLGLVSWSLEVEGLKAAPYRDTRGPGRSGVRALFHLLAKDETPKARRDLALLRLLYDCALRRGEAVGLDTEDVDLDGSRVFILGKGRTGKEPVTLPEPTAAALRAWLDVHPTSEGPLFVSLDRAHARGRLSGRSVGRLVAALGERVGLTIRPHGLRHAAVTDALDATGGDVRKVARFSRHKDLRVLNHYDDNREDLGGEVARLVAGMV